MPDLKPGLLSPEAIGDPEAKRVIKQMQELLNVRQGYVGDKENAFVTFAQLRKVGINVPRSDNLNGTSSSLSGTFTTNAGTVRGRLESLLGTNIGAIEEVILSSPQFQFLGAPVKRIDGLGAKIIKLEKKLDNKFSSFAEMTAVLQAAVGDQRVTLEQISQVTVDLDRNARAQYTVKIDNNGYVSGFGLFSTSVLGGPVDSEFYIRADKFAIGSPTAPNRKTIDGAGNVTYSPPDPAAVPFIVFTTPTIVNGKTVAPGVFMRRTFIHDGAIENAMIGNAAINTLEIAGDAVTVSSAATGGSVSLTDSYQLATSLTLVYEGIAPGQTLLMVSGYAQGNGSGTSPFSVNFELRVNGSAVQTSADSILNDWGCSPSFSYIASGLGVGTHTITVYAKTQQTGTNATASNITIAAIGLKR